MNAEWMTKNRQNILLVGIGTLIFLIYFFAENLPPSSSDAQVPTKHPQASQNRKVDGKEEEKLPAEKQIKSEQPGKLFSNEIMSGNLFSNEVEVEVNSFEKYTKFKSKSEPEKIKTFRDFLVSLKNQDNFAEYFISILRNSKFTAFFFECPSLVESFLEKEFEFVLTKSTMLERAHPEPHVFKEHFSWKQDPDTFSSTVFDNMGGDATLVVPYPAKTSLDNSHVIKNYAHLAQFVRNSQVEETLELFSLVGQTLLTSVETGESPVWLSTSGTGVFWLHVRLDSRPKYYTYRQYKLVEYLQNL